VQTHLPMEIIQAKPKDPSLDPVDPSVD